MLWAGIVLPQLALDGVLRRHPAPGRPLAIVDGPAQRRELLAVNAAAAAAGLRPGLGLNAAHALLAQFELHAFDAVETARLRRLLAAWAYRFSSLVCLEGEDALLLEVGASLGLFGPWPVFAQRLGAELTALGFQHRIALAPTPLAACVLAGARPGARVDDPRALRRALEPVPLGQARLGATEVAALDGMGVRLLRELFPLPRAGLARRFGAALPDWLARLLGEAPDPRRYYQPPDAFESRLEFHHEVAQHPPLLFPLRRMLGDLGIYLARRDGGVQRFELHLLHAERPATVLRLGLLRPARDPAHLFDLCRTRLAQLTLAAPVRGLRLLAPELPPFIPVTPDLFTTRHGEQLSWTVLRERLRARLGDGALTQLQATADPRPEHSVHAVPELAAEPAPVTLPPRPLWLLPAPVPWRDGGLRILAGPERIEAGWWDGGDLRRDYYVIETRQGQQAWMFRPAGQQEGPWMLHGWFA